MQLSVPRLQPQPGEDKCPNITLTDARVRALRPRKTAIRHPRWQAQRLRRPRPALRPKTLLSSIASIAESASGRSSETPRFHECRRGAVSRRPRYLPRSGGERIRLAIPARPSSRPSPRRCSSATNGSGRREPQCEPGLSAPTDPAAFRGTPGRRHRPPGGPQLVRLAARDAGRGRSLHAGALRHHEGGGSDGPSARGLQPLPGHPALPPQGARALPVRRRDRPPGRNSVGPCRAGSRYRSPPSAFFC